MKRFLVFTMTFFILLSIKAQNTSTKDAKKIRGMKMVVALAEYKKKASAEEKEIVDSFNMLFEKYMKAHWTYNEIVDFMPLSEAEKFVKNNKKTHCYIYLGEDVTTNFKQGNTRYICYGNLLAIFAPKRIAIDALPYFDGKMDEASIVFSVLQLQYLLTILENGDADHVMWVSKFVKKNNGPKAIKKTLLIPAEYLSPKISKDDIKLAYPYDFEICSNEKIEKAILERDPKYTVVFYVPIMAGSGWVHFLYLSSAEDGEIYGVEVKGNVRLNGISLNGGKRKYVINKKELKMIGNMVD